MREVRRVTQLAGTAIVCMGLLSACQADRISHGDGRVPRALAIEGVSRAIQKADIRNGVPGGRWIAEVHAAVMQDALANGVALKSANGPDRCAMAAAMIRKQFGRINAETGVSVASLNAMLAGALDRSGCATGRTSSVFGLALVSPTIGAVDDTVTGAFDAYTSSIADAIVADSPQQSEAQISTVLASATSLPSGDYQVLSGIASLAVSDAYYWYGVQSSGGCGNCGGDPPLQMSIFWRSPALLRAPTPVGYCMFWCRAGWTDVIGAGAGAMAVVYTAGPGVVVAPQAVLAGSVIGAASASLMYAVAAM